MKQTTEERCEEAAERLQQLQKMVGDAESKRQELSKLDTALELRHAELNDLIAEICGERTALEQVQSRYNDLTPSHFVNDPNWRSKSGHGPWAKSSSNSRLPKLIPRLWPRAQQTRTQQNSGSGWELR